MKKKLNLMLIFALLAITSCTKDNELSTLNNIDTFKVKFNGIDEKDVTYDLGNTITISVPFKTNLSGLKTTIVVSEKATISPASGSVVNFVDGVAVPFTVTAQDGLSKKVYNVIINIRGEVGSGSKLKTYRSNDAFRGDVLTSYKYAASNFVNEYSTKAGSETNVYTLVYNTKNQVIEKKSDDLKESTIYTYNNKGQISSSTYKEKNVLIYTYTYTYDATSENLISEKRLTAKDDKTSEITFEYKNKNVIKENRYAQVYTATYEDKNNPFKGIYPVAYSAINVGIQLVNANNPVTGTFSDDKAIYTYNAANYPLTSKYTYFGGLASVEKTFTYYPN